MLTITGSRKTGKTTFLASLMAMLDMACAPSPRRMSVVLPTNPRNRGKARPAGSKLARKAAKGTIGVKSGPNSLRPRMPNRFPFSAKR